MRHFVFSAFALALTAGLTSCASVEPEPCTAEWVEWKSERVLFSFARQNRGVVNDLRKFSKGMDSIGPLEALQMAARIDDFKSLAVSFEKTVLPELNAAVEQCGTPAQFVPAFTEFLRDEGVDEEMLKWVTAFGVIAIEAAQKN